MPIDPAETFVPDNLQVGNFPVQTDKQILFSGQNVARGEALGKITASGKLKILQSGSGDGSQNAYVIATEDVDASGGDEFITVFLSGGFNRDKVKFDGADTFNTFKDQFRDLGIYLEPAQASE